jgi:hypothetical protein
MDARVFAIWFVLPIVLLIEVGAIRYAWRGEGGHVVPGGIERGMASLSHNRSGTAVIVGLCVVLTLIAWTYEFVFGQVLLYVVLFSMGRAAAAVGLVAFVGVLALTPVLLARLALKLLHHEAGAPGRLPWVGG